MGYEFEVEEYCNVNAGNDKEPNYRWKMIYAGNDKNRAFEILEELKKDGKECVRITWR